MKKQHNPLICFTLLLSLYFAVAVKSAPIQTTEQLLQAVSQAEQGAEIQLAAGTFELKEPLRLKSGITLSGAGICKTIIKPVSSWKPSTASLPDPEVKLQGLDSEAYLIRIEDKAEQITINQLTLQGPHVHGAIFSFRGKQLHFHDLEIKDFLWSGIRTYGMEDSKIMDCQFMDAGGRWKRGGTPGVDGGISAGAIFAVWSSNIEIAHNRISRTNKEKQRAHFGIKGRGGKNWHIHHNTIGVNFSIEFPFESHDSMEIDHNICHGVISIPKYAGGKVPESGSTFHIHHNYFTTSYAIEFVRNGVEIDHNLFDFDVNSDGGNLISGFGKAPTPGPAVFHNNLVNNPGRGVIWINEPYNNLTVRNNHIVTRTTVTPRKEGLFGLNSQSDFSTVQISDNIIQCIGLARPLLRNKESYGATIENNLLTNVSDTDLYENRRTDKKPGLESPLNFKCGVHEEKTVTDWKFEDTKGK